MSTNASFVASLVPLAGPPMRAILLEGRAGEALIGRQSRCTVRLAAEAVSRVHARLRHNSGQWSITDLASRWGTFLNGCKLSPETEMPLKPGDLIRIQPWTFRFSP